MAMKREGALKALTKALTGDTVRFTEHALEMLTFAELDLVFVEAELRFAVHHGFVDYDRNSAGRFVAHGRATILVFEVVAPAVVVVTIMIQE